MKKNKGIKLPSILSLAILAGGLVTSVFLVQQRQRIASLASGNARDPLAEVVSPDIGCKCVGPAACAKLTTNARCNANQKCGWLCSPAPQSTIITPHNGEIWERGKTYQITWEQTQITASTALFLYARNETTDKYLGVIGNYVSNAVGTNSYTWTIPFQGLGQITPPDGDNIIIGVGQFNSRGDLISSDKSDAPLTVTTAPPTLLTPNGGEVWVRGKSYIVSWNQSITVGSTSLHLHTLNPDETDNYVGAIEYYTSNAPGINRYLWTIPPAVSDLISPPDGNNVLLEVVLHDLGGNPISSDKSISPFTIIAPSPTPAR